MMDTSTQKYEPVKSCLCSRLHHSYTRSYPLNTLRLILFITSWFNCRPLCLVLSCSSPSSRSASIALFFLTSPCSTSVCFSRRSDRYVSLLSFCRSPKAVCHRAWSSPWPSILSLVPIVLHFLQVPNLASLTHNSSDSCGAFPALEWRNDCFIFKNAFYQKHPNLQLLYCKTCDGNNLLSLHLNYVQTPYLHCKRGYQGSQIQK